MKKNMELFQTKTQQRIIIDKEFNALIPPLTDEEYNGLEESILNEGCRDSLVAWNGILIDGHNRHEICTKHNLDYDILKKEFENRDTVKEWIIINQFSRRNLSAYDRALLALKYKPIFEKKARERQKCGQGGLLLNQNSDEANTNKELGKMVGLSHDTIWKVEKIEEKCSDEIKYKIRNSGLSINQAYMALRKEEKLERVEQRIIENSKKPTGYIDIYNTDKKFNIIYADPPWLYWQDGNFNARLHYRCMTIQEICELPVKDITADDCILFLWVTHPMLEECFKVIKAWGFRYSTCGFAWVKKNKVQDTNVIGLGKWTRANTELCLIAVKGTILRLDNTISQLIETPREEHSKKPAITRELITRLVGELPRIELFSRQVVEGWNCWGNEVEK